MTGLLFKGSEGYEPAAQFGNGLDFERVVPP